MKKLKFILLAITVFGGQLLFAQSRAAIEAYIQKYRDIAMAEMQRTGVPASVTLAQGIHETGAGTSDLVLKSNNHFGIKCKTEWEGEKVYHDDDARGECFRKYNDPTISYRDHSDFLKTRPNYAALFKLDPTDYEAWAFGLKKAGYATNPRYPQILINLIRDYHLQDYTLVALGKKTIDGNTPDWVQVTEGSAAPEAEMEAPKTIYPEGIFKINDTKVIFITRGTSYLKVAEENDISLSRLMDFNDMNDEDIAANDGLLYLQRKRKTGAAAVHVVTSGESLHDIAQTEGIRLESLLQYNFLTAGVLVEVGEKLYLTTSAPTLPRLAPPKTAVVKAVYKPLEPAMEANPESGYLVHVVQPKETVYSIARKYEVGVDDVKKWNDLPTNDLKIGQQVRIKQTR